MKLASTKKNPDTFPVLVSFAYFKSDSAQHLLNELLRQNNCHILLDSGAFTFHKTGVTMPLEHYYKFLDKWADKIWGYIALDVPGNPKKSKRNTDQMYRDGYEPIPVHVLGDDEKRMDELYEQSELVCLASLPINERRMDKNKAYIKMKTKWAKGRPVHWLGYADEGMIRTFEPYSCDASTWASATMWGQCLIYFGNGRRIMLRAIDLRQGKTDIIKKHEKEIMQLLTRLRIMPQDFFNPDKWTGVHERNPSAVLSIYSWIQYVREIRARFNTYYFLVMPDSILYLELFLKVLARCENKEAPKLKSYTRIKRRRML